jgi:hypothetical protein
MNYDQSSFCLFCYLLSSTYVTSRYLNSFSWSQNFYFNSKLEIELISSSLVLSAVMFESVIEMLGKIVKHSLDDSSISSSLISSGPMIKSSVDISKHQGSCESSFVLIKVVVGGSKVVTKVV